MIIAVYNTTGIVYTSDSSSLDYNKEHIVVLNCTFEQTSYGSVIIKRPTDHRILELYPNAITHIISN